MRQIEENTAELRERIDTLEDAYESVTKENKVLWDEIKKIKSQKKTSSRKEKEKPPSIVAVSQFLTFLIATCSSCLQITEGR